MSLKTYQKYKDKVVLKNISLKIEKGDLVAFIVKVDVERLLRSK